MGKFMYEALRVDFEDRVLAHLQYVIGAKLRRGESFHFSWRDDASIGDGRTTIWIHPSATIVYKYYGSRPPAINRAWIEALSQAANSASGLHLVPEPDEPARRPDEQARSGEL
ncbi:ATP-dependent DNA ligase [Agromyces sp. NPDC058064]|uniref:DUF7882 family protein n=1 Tax=Agromyces sp. NPDC058064 TaxID=3346322 RepID=UPI0036DD95EC